MMRVDFVNRDGGFLARRSAEGRINAAVAIDDGIRNRVEAIRDQDAYVALIGRVADDHFTSGRAFGDAGDDERIGADDDGRPELAELDVGSICAGESFAANLKFTARDRGGRRYVRDLRAVGWFTKGHIKTC